MSDDLTIQTKALHSIERENNAVKKAEALTSRDLNSKAELEKATKGFEALLLHQMLKSMWATIDTTGLLGEDSNQGQIFRGMFHQAVADEIAEGKGIGVQDFLEKELIKMTGASKKETPEQN